MLREWVGFALTACLVELLLIGGSGSRVELLKELGHVLFGKECVDYFLEKGVDQSAIKSGILKEFEDP